MNSFSAKELDVLIQEMEHAAQTSDGPTRQQAWNWLAKLKMIRAMETNGKG